MTQEGSRLERRRLAKALTVWVNVILYLVVLAGVLLTVVWPLLSLAGHEEYEITVPVAFDVTALPLPGGIEGFSFEEVQGELKLPPGHSGAAIGFWFFSVVFIGALIYGLWLLRKILATAAQGSPFDPANPRRLNHLGWVMIGTSIVATVSQAILGRWALSQLGSSELPLSSPWDLNQAWLTCGLLILVLASIWKQAVQMAEEQSLTV